LTDKAVASVVRIENLGNVALILIDNPPVNASSQAVRQGLSDAVAAVNADPSAEAVVIACEGRTFVAGADIKEFGKPPLTPSLPDVLNIVEASAKPVVAAIHGTALGGGFELALACHARVMDDKAVVGLPEVKLGLIPGAGGTQRLPRLIGVMKAAPYLLEGKTMSPQEALAMGVVNEVVPEDQLITAARKYLTGKPDAVAPWDKKEFKIPGGGPYHPSVAQIFIMGNAMLRKQSYGNYPAQINIMKCVYEGLQVPIDAALRIESRYFAKTAMTPQARGMVRTLFNSMEQLGKGAMRPQGAAKSSANKVAVLGAGMMGAGIAYVQAGVGIDTVLIDTTQEGAEKGRDYSKKLVEKAVKRGRMTQDKADALLARITPTTDYDQIKGADLVIEAVFEDRALKADVTRRAEAQLAESATFGSNTSTIPITGLAEASARPANFIGIHFFSPVDRMGLVEIIVAKETSDETLAKAIDYVLKIKKTPIVVNDSRGFYTSRCFGTFVQEGLEMLVEGIAPAIIDNVGRATGMPRGPLEMNDDVALDLGYKVREQARKDMGDAYVAMPSDALIAKMVTELGRYGRKNGKGFYDYAADGTKRLWDGLADLAPVKIAEADPALIEELRTRLLYRQAVEAARCMAENVVTDPRQADVGAILGWGFAPWTGGPISLIDGVGLQAFVRTCDELARKHGPRFAPPQMLRDMAGRGESFYGPKAAAIAA
jgi:3-hydroxyacyl-CoA dehydrogenase / enoyl-CoA hydratase / 3-hydroxybutyryl-CoA epimerase